MPFQQLIPHAFNTRSVQCYAPALPGVYGISSARDWIFIGQSDDIRGALLAHLRVLNAAAPDAEATGFVFEACMGDQRRIRQERLVLEYAPVFGGGLPRRSQTALQRRQG